MREPSVVRGAVFVLLGAVIGCALAVLLSGVLWSPFAVGLGAVGSLVSAVAVAVAVR